MPARRPQLLLGLAAAVLAVVVLAFFTTRSSAPTYFRLVVTLSEGYVDYAQAMRNAAQLAFDEAPPMPSNRLVELVFINSTDPENLSSEAYEAQIIEQLADDERVLAMIGSYSSGEARQSIPVANAARLALISPSATWPGLTKPGFAVGEPGVYYRNGQRNFFRVVPSDDLQGAVAAHWLMESELQRVYIVHTSTLYSSGLTGIFESQAEVLGLQVLGKATFDLELVSDSEIEGIVARVRDAQPQAIFVPISWEGRAGDVMRALRRAFPSRVFLGSDAMMQNSLTEYNDALHNIYATNITPPIERLESAQGFLARYEARYGVRPDDYLLPMYEAVQVALWAISEAERPERESVLQRLRTMDSYEGVLGRWSFDRNGDTSLNTIALARFEDKPGGTRGDIWRSIGLFTP